MAKDCTLPLSQKLAALVSTHTSWPLEDVELLLEQGFPPSLEECWDDPDEIRQYCLSLVEQATAPGANQH
jgi:nitrogen-specific signal transduction histidine kinase